MYIDSIRDNASSPEPIFLRRSIFVFMKYSGTSTIVSTPQYMEGEPSGRQVSYISGRRFLKKSMKSNCVFHSKEGEVKSSLPSFSEK